MGRPIVQKGPASRHARWRPATARRRSSSIDAEAIVLTDRLVQLSTALGHSFHDLDLLRDAATHSSLVNEPRGKGRGDTRRLAFLGDAVLELVVRTTLFQRFPNATKGQLTTAKRDLVRNASLAKLVRDKGLAHFLNRGGSVQADNDTILAEFLEAMIAAVFRDGGYAATEDVIVRLLPWPTQVPLTHQ